MYRYWIIVLCLVSVTVQADWQKIETAWQRGELTQSERLYNLFLDLRAPEELPAALTSPFRRPLRSGFALNAYLKEHLNEVDEPFRSRMSKVLNTRPGGLPHSYSSPVGNFLIHYARVGRDAPDSADINANQIPDYVEQVAEIFDYAYHLEIDSFGYQKYKQDNIDGPQFDVYILELSSSYYGMTEWDELSCAQCTPWIRIDNDYNPAHFSTSGIEGLKVTAAHEFFHALQLGYRWDAGLNNSNIYWYEVSSTWMEDMAYDEINDYYQYLDTYFDNPNNSLTTANGSAEYSKALWNFYISEKYSPELIRQCWEEFAHPGRTPLECFETVLPGGFTPNFIQFAYWNTFTGIQTRADSFYSEGSNYPELNLIPWSQPGTIPVVIYSLATKYYVYTPIKNGGLRLHYYPDCAGFFKGVMFDGSYHTLFFNQTLSAVPPAIFPNLSLYREVIIGLVNPTTTSINSAFTLEFDSTLINLLYIKGTVFSHSGKPLAGAKIKIFEPLSQYVISLTESDAAGQFTLPVIESFIHQSLSLHIEAPGYEIVEIPSVIPGEVDDTTLTFTVNKLSDKQIGAWPNPFHDEITFGYYQPYDYPQAEPWHIQIYTINGQIVYETRGAAAENHVALNPSELSGLMRGVYIYYFQLGTISRQGKLIKN